MLSTDATFSLDYFFEYLAIGCFLSIFHYHVYMDVTVSNMPIAHHFCFDTFPQFANEVGPLFDIIRKVICDNLSLLLSSN